MMRRIFAVLGTVVAAGAVSPVFGAGLVAQAENLASQTLGRPYWHFFLAYAIAWVFIFGWIISIARRLRRVETRLQADQG